MSMKLKFIPILLAVLVAASAAAGSETPLPVKYMQRYADGKYRHVARFMDSRACEKYRAMQAQIVCVETGLCKTRPETCAGKPISSGPVSCWRDSDLGPDFGNCE
jgi:hypothetical protein